MLSLDRDEITPSLSMLIGVVGGLLGLLFGFILSSVISILPFETKASPTIRTFPVDFNFMYYIIGIIFALATTFIAEYSPAKKASKVDPVEIIRGK